MKTNKVTREDLRSFRDGETRTYELPDYDAVLSAKTNAYTTARLEKCRFICKCDSLLPVITITRMPS